MVRIKQRYLLFNILYPAGPAALAANIAYPGISADNDVTQSMAFTLPSPASLNRSTLASIIRNSISHNFGDWGIGQAGGFAVKYFSSATSTGILRITRENYRILWAALTFINELYGQPAVFRVVRVSGTIRKAEVAAIKLSEETIRKVKKEAKGGSGGKDVVSRFASTSKGTASKQPTVEDEEDLPEMDMEMVDIVDSDVDGDDDD